MLYIFSRHGTESFKRKYTNAINHIIRLDQERKALRIKMKEQKRSKLNEPRNIDTRLFKKE